MLISTMSTHTAKWALQSLLPHRLQYIIMPGGLEGWCDRSSYHPSEPWGWDDMITSPSSYQGNKGSQLSLVNGKGRSKTGCVMTMGKGRLAFRLLNVGDVMQAWVSIRPSQMLYTTILMWPNVKCLILILWASCGIYWNTIPYTSICF